MYVCMYVCIYVCTYVSLIGSKRSKIPRLSFRIHKACRDRDSGNTKISSTTFLSEDFIAFHSIIEVTPVYD